MEHYENKISIKSWAEEDRPREKLSAQGRRALTDAELIAILIGSGSRTESAVELSKRILHHYDNDLNKLAKASINELSHFRGIGEAKAISIIAALEIGRRRNETESKAIETILSSKDGYNIMRRHLVDLNHEEFWIILLGRSSKVLGKELISKGGLAGTIADPKMIFHAALQYQASGIILVHNHPSGNLKPSHQDISLTKNLASAGKMLEIRNNLSPLSFRLSPPNPIFADYHFALMKISYNWLKQFIETDKTPEQFSQILTGIGLEVESLEKVQAIPGGLEGLVIGYVKDCVQHPNADRLRITKVDAGTGTELQIVCGASNVAAGQKVVVATVGTTVYPVGGEPFQIKKSKIRGEESEGMICAEDEIGLGESHEGIMILDANAPIGDLAKDYFKLTDDYLYEIGLTPNRADAASHLGTARDIAAFLKTSLIKPDVSGFKLDNTNRKVEVVVENEIACPRYSSLTISGIEVKDSPKWLKEKLAVIGLRSINNVVDVTNYVLHGLGQPLHAFDADAIKGNKVIVKTCPEGTPFKTLDEVDRKLSADDLMICNAEEPMCIAGVFGGIGSGVKSSTKNIFLESAYFNPVWVRKTSKRHGLKTDASFRFERGTDPDVTVFALKYAALLIKEVAGGTISSDISDIYPNPVAPFAVDITYRNVDRLIGKSISHEEIKSIIVALDIQIVKESVEGLSLKVPPYRVDVTREVDVIEEILRIYGYNNIEIPNQIRASLNNSVRPEKDDVQNSISDLLTSNGFNEILSNSLTKSAYSTDLDHAVKILNPLSNDLDVMRQSMLFSGLEAIAYNQNRRNADLKLYEFGKVYSVKDEKYNETQRFSIFLTGADRAEQWNQKPKQVSFFMMKAIVDGLLERLNITDVVMEDATCSKMAFGIQYMRNGKQLVKFGSVAATSLKKVDLDKEVFYADFNFDMILAAVRKNKIVYKEVSKFPAVRRDLSMLVDTNITFGQLKQIAERSERKLLKEINVFDVYQGDKLPAGKKSYALSFTLQDEEKTLTDKTIDAIIQKLIYNFGKEAGAEIRK